MRTIANIPCNRYRGSRLQLDKMMGFNIIVVVSIILSIGSNVVTVELSKSVPPKTANTGPGYSDNPPELGVYSRAAVASHAKECSEIGSEILAKNGSAVDAAIAALLCQGILSPHSMGLGGGFGMTIYNATSGKAEFLDAREAAPARATRNMFGNNPNASRYGGLAIAVPGILAGLWEAHQRYGKLPWRELFLPSIQLCETGIIVTPYLAGIMERRISFIQAEPSLAEIFIDPKTNYSWIAGDKLPQPKLTRTMRTLAEHGIDSFYNGTIGEAIVKEIQNFGGIIEMDDLRNYRPKWKEPVKTTIGNNLTIYTSNLPGSGVLLTFIMNVLDNFLPSPDQNIFWQRLVETFKWAYGHRTQLGDISSLEADNLIATLTSKGTAKTVRQKIKDNWTSNDSAYYGAVLEVPDDYGTAHIAVLAPDGSAVSVTSTINQPFGAMKRSLSTGIIFNDQMDDFGAPNVINGYNVRPSPPNYIAPGKRPLSSTVPTIIVDGKGEVQLVIGGTGGPRITTAVALITVLNMWGGYDIKRAIEAPRFHHQLLPMHIEVPRNFPPRVLDYLRNANHHVVFSDGAVSTVNAISRFNSPNITAYCDYQRYGVAAGF